jgi:hypothetical protein
MGPIIPFGSAPLRAGVSLRWRLTNAGLFRPLRLVRDATKSAASYFSQRDLSNGFPLLTDDTTPPLGGPDRGPPFSKNGFVVQGVDVRKRSAVGVADDLAAGETGITDLAPLKIRLRIPRWPA